MSEPFSKAYKIAIEIYYMLFLKILFLERGEGRKKEAEKHQSAASHVPPVGDPARNPRMYPTQELNQWLFDSLASTQSTEPHQPGLY